MTDQRKLYRTRDNKMIAGVLSGLSDYLNVDASIMRLGYAALTLLTGIIPGMVLYVLMVIIIPPEPKPRGD
jgi:phage shock protein C